MGGIAALGVFLAGCGVGSARKNPLELQVRALETEKAQLGGALEQRDIQIAQLKAQIEALSALPADRRENPYVLDDVKITRYTNFYDRDADGKRESLIVYLQPIDRDGSVFKAAGVVSVQLWDLDKPGAQALLGQWQVPAEELHQLWFDSLLSTSYRLIFSPPITPAVLAVPLTVKIAFTDYFTGRIFDGQYVIEPRTE